VTADPAVASRRVERRDAHGGAGAAVDAPLSSGTLFGVWAAWPFDTMREQYASAVCAGWLPKSMLASRDVELALDRLERSVMGRWARTV
jgi:hypothetical protein